MGYLSKISGGSCRIWVVKSSNGLDGAKRLIVVKLGRRRRFYFALPVYSFKTLYFKLWWSEAIDVEKAGKQGGGRGKKSLVIGRGTAFEIWNNRRLSGLW